MVHNEIAASDDSEGKPAEAEDEDAFQNQRTAGHQYGIVTLVVGEERKRYYVHANLLRQKSPSFRAALLEAWHRDRWSELSLEHEDPEVVESMIDWIYHGTISKLTTGILDFKLAMKCYKFSEVRMMYDLKNKIMDAVRHEYAKHNYLVEARELEDAYALDLRNTQMGAFLVKAVVYEVMNNLFDQAWQDNIVGACIENGIAEDIVKEILEYRKKKYGSPYDGAGCFFHDHSDGSSCIS